MAQQNKSAAANSKKERKSLFSQKTKYVGATKSLTLYVREASNGKFRTYAILETNGVEKKDKGVHTEHNTKDEAMKKFRELSEQCIAAGWKEKSSSSSKSAFDVIPQAA